MDVNHVYIIRQMQMASSAIWYYQHARRVSHEADTALEGLDGTINIADDILVYGEGNNFEDAQADHDRRLIALMERFHQRSIKLNAGKLRFKLKEVKFMGTIISGNGMKPDPDEVAAITQMPTPQNKPALLRFIGMVNYLLPLQPPKD